MCRLQIRDPSSVELQSRLPRIREICGVTGSGHTRSRFLFTQMPGRSVLGSCGLLHGGSWPVGPRQPVVRRVPTDCVLHPHVVGRRELLRIV